MKKFISEFKEFALRGNVMDLAVGVIIGAAFGDIVTAFTDDIINTLINCIGGAKIGGKIQILTTGQYINYGHLLTAIINFLIMAFAIFCMVKAVNTLSNIGKKKEEEKPTVKKCPHCLSEIPIKATKCKYCGSDIELSEDELDKE